MESFKELTYALQKKVEWRYYKNGKWKIGEDVGVDEDSNNIFLHPPRRYDFRFTELTSFPEFHYGIVLVLKDTISSWRVLKQWGGQLDIGKGWKEYII